MPTTPTSHSQNIHPNGHLTCEWCNTRYEPRSHSGRTPRYCKASHRVRASERRRGLLRPTQPPPRTHLPKPTQQNHLVGIEQRNHNVIDNLNAIDYLATQIGHETGNGRTLHPRTIAHWGYHRAQPAGLPNKTGYVPSLCGTMIKIIGLPTGVAPHRNTCKTCERLADLHPTTDTWWTATTHRTATALANDLTSTILTIGQAITGKRNPTETLIKTNQQLRDYMTQIGLANPLEPSYHPRSTAA